MLTLSRQSSPKGCNVALRRFIKLPIVIAFATLAFAGLVYLFAWSSIFSVSSVAVIGAPTVDAKKSILDIAMVVPGEKIARVEPQAIAHRIEQTAWIESVDISRNWISGGVTIRIQPRTPTAFFNDATIDSTGRIFFLPGFTSKKLPSVTAANPELGLAAIELFNGLPQEFQAKVSTLSVPRSANFMINLLWQGRPIKITWGKNEQNTLKVEVIQALLELSENKNVRRIDVSAPHAPIVR